MISRLPQKNRAPREASKYFDGAVSAAEPVVGRCGKRRYHGNSRRSGFSLLEVTIALVVFVVGALAIVRIFPGALGVVQTSENRGVGARLAQQTLARYENDPLSAPYAIYDFDAALFNANTNPGGWSDFNGAVSGTVNRNSSLPATPAVKDDIIGANYLQSSIGQSALGRFGYITGEGHNVPDAANGGQNFVLTRFPYQVKTLRIFRELEVNGVVLEATGELDFSNATVQTPNGQTSFNDAAPNTKRPILNYLGASRVDFQFFVSYRWIDTSTKRMSGVTDEPKSFPAAAGTAVEASVLHCSTSIPSHSSIAGPVRVRVRIPVVLPATPPAGFPQDVDKAARGIGIYNIPAPPVLSPGERISFDYQIRDWRWITVDGSASTPTDPPKDDNATLIPPPTGNPPDARQMELPIRYVTTEDPNPNGTPRDYPLYSLFSGVTAAGVPISPYLSEWSPESFATPSNTNGGPNYYNLWKVEPKSGRVVFNTTTGTTPSAVNQVRVVYRSVDGWGHQVAVAAKNYVPFVPTGVGTTYNPRQPWREYFADLPNHKLYFHPSDAGHSLMVSFEYLEKPANVFRKVVNQMVTLSDEIVPRPSTVNAAFNGNARTSSGIVPTNGVVEGTLLDLSGNPIDGTKAQITAITAVKGVSIRARSAWVDGDRYSQTGVVGYRKNTD